MKTRFRALIKRTANVYVDDCPLSIPRQDDNETEDGCGNLIPAQNSKIQLPRRHRMENGGCDRYVSVLFRTAFDCSCCLSSLFKGINPYTCTTCIIFISKRVPFELYKLQCGGWKYSGILVHKFGIIKFRIYGEQIQTKQL